MISKIARKAISAVLAVLPPGAPNWIYTVLLSPAPLRRMANTVLRKLIPECIELPEGKLFLNPDDPVVSGALMLGAYEPGSIAYWRTCLTRPDMTVLDLGANIGLYTLIAAGHVPEGMVIAFEPQKENADILERTLAFNAATNVKIVRKGVGAESGELPLHLDPDNKGKHSLVSSPGSPTSVETIPVVTVDEALAHMNVSSVDLVKIDIEGWEAQALAGMRTTLEKHHPIILFEFMPAWIRDAGDSPEEMLQSLQGLGYRLSLLPEGTGSREEPVEDISALLALFKRRDDYRNMCARYKHEN